MKVFVHCLQVLLMGVSFKSWGWPMSQTSQKNACKMCGKLLVLSGLNLSRVLFIAVVPFWYSGGKTQRLFDNDLHDFFE